ncbi:MAG: diacylglycerol kinase family protein [Myxococcota bacterium]
MPSPESPADYTTRYRKGLDPNARVRPGLLSNPLARTNWRTVGHGKLSALLPDRAAAIETPSIHALEPALETLLFEHAVNVLVLNGGDGTIHHTLNAAIRVTDRHQVPMPLFLFVNGGGMNMLARVFGTRGHPVRTFERFLGHIRGARFGSVPKRGVPLLAAREPDGNLRHGTIFGSELVFNALTMYERFGQGYRGLTRFLFEVAAGYTLRTELWNRFGHLLDAPTTPLVIDGDVFPRYTSVVATTVPLQLVKGAVATVRRMSSPGGMSVVGVLPIDKGEVIALIPPLMIGARARGLEYRRDVQCLSLHGAYTLDGERFDRHERDARAPLEVIGTRRVVWGVWL